jgi:hypothetical protein
MVDQPGQRRDRRDLDALDQRRLVGVGGLDEGGPQAGLARDRGHRQHPGRVAQRAVERQPADERGREERRGRDLGAGAQPDRERECMRSPRAAALTDGATPVGGARRGRSPDGPWHFLLDRTPQRRREVLRRPVDG